MPIEIAIIRNMKKNILMDGKKKKKTASVSVCDSVTGVVVYVCHSA